MISDSSNKAIHKHHLQLHQLKAERATKQMSYDIKKSQMHRGTHLVAPPARLPWIYNKL